MPSMLSHAARPMPVHPCCRDQSGLSPFEGPPLPSPGHVPTLAGTMGHIAPYREHRELSVLVTRCDPSSGAIPDQRSLPSVLSLVSCSAMAAMSASGLPGAGRDSGAVLAEAYPLDAPEPPSTANGRHQLHAVNLKRARALNPAS